MTNDYMELLELAEDPDIDEQAFMDTLEGIEGALEDKADNYAKCMRMLEADAKGIKAEEEKDSWQTPENNRKQCLAHEVSCNTLWKRPARQNSRRSFSRSMSRIIPLPSSWTSQMSPTFRSAS